MSPSGRYADAYPRDVSRWRRTRAGIRCREHQVPQDSDAPERAGENLEHDLALEVLHGERLGVLALFAFSASS